MIDKELFDIRLYSLNGKIVFPIRGVSGGITSSYVAYLIAKVENKYYSYPVNIVPKDWDSLSNFENRAILALNDNNIMEEFYQDFGLKIVNNCAHEFSLDGGDMGIPDKNTKIVV